MKRIQAVAPRGKKDRGKLVADSILHEIAIACAVFFFTRQYLFVAQSISQGCLKFIAIRE